eukprot:scaffold10743_cov58-Attheya_sp.AAC.6
MHRACDILTRREPETAIKVTKLTYPDDDEAVVKETPGSVTRTLGETGEEKWVLSLPQGRRNTYRHHASPTYGFEEVSLAHSSVAPE